MISALLLLGAVIGQGAASADLGVGRRESLKGAMFLAQAGAARDGKKEGKKEGEAEKKNDGEVGKKKVDKMPESSPGRTPEPAPDQTSEAEKVIHTLAEQLDLNGDGWINGKDGLPDALFTPFTRLTNNPLTTVLDPANHVSKSRLQDLAERKTDPKSVSVLDELKKRRQQELLVEIKYVDWIETRPSVTKGYVSEASEGKLKIGGIDVPVADIHTLAVIDGFTPEPFENCVRNLAKEKPNLDAADGAVKLLLSHLAENQTKKEGEWWNRVVTPDLLFRLAIAELPTHPERAEKRLKELIEKFATSWRVLPARLELAKILVDKKLPLEASQQTDAIVGSADQKFIVRMFVELFPRFSRNKQPGFLSWYQKKTNATASATPAPPSWLKDVELAFPAEGPNFRVIEELKNSKTPFLSRQAHWMLDAEQKKGLLTKAVMQLKATGDELAAERQKSINFKADLEAESKRLSDETARWKVEKERNEALAKRINQPERPNVLVIVDTGSDLLELDIQQELEEAIKLAARGAKEFGKNESFRVYSNYQSDSRRKSDLSRQVKVDPDDRDAELPAEISLAWREFPSWTGPGLANAFDQVYQGNDRAAVIVHLMTPSVSGDFGEKPDNIITKAKNSGMPTRVWFVQLDQVGREPRRSPAVDQIVADLGGMFLPVAASQKGVSKQLQGILFDAMGLSSEQRKQIVEMKSAEQR